jgi:hypothetical protein
MTSWCLAFPYCPNEPVRAEAFEIVRGFYAHHFPDIPQLVHSATAIGEPFLRARTRNELVQMADGFDVVVLVDADTLLWPSAITSKVAAAGEQGFYLGKPFLRGVNVPLDGLQLLADCNLNQWPHARFNDPGAAWIVRPSSWWRAGGMDENFTSWGGEDESFMYLFSALGGVTEYDHLAAVKAEHAQPRWRQAEGWLQTLQREFVCRHVAEHPELVREWLAVRDQPGIVESWIKRFAITDRRLERAATSAISRT